MTSGVWIRIMQKLEKSTRNNWGFKNHTNLVFLRLKCGFLLLTFTCTCTKLLFCDWLVYIVSFWCTRVFIRSYHTINHDTVLLDPIQQFRVHGCTYYTDKIRTHEVANMLPFLTDLTHLNRWEPFGRPFIPNRPGQ